MAKCVISSDELFDLTLQVVDLEFILLRDNRPINIYWHLNWRHLYWNLNSSLHFNWAINVNRLININWFLNNCWNFNSFNYLTRRLVGWLNWYFLLNFDIFWNLDNFLHNNFWSWHISRDFNNNFHRFLNHNLFNNLLGNMT